MVRLRDRGARLCLPVILDKKTIVFRELADGVAVVETGFGTTGPGPAAPELDPDIMFGEDYDKSFATGPSITVSLRTLPGKPLIHVLLGV